MTEVSPVSPDQLQDRRHSLRRQRRFKIIQKLWQMWAMAALTGGLFWAASHPIWLIRDANQITIEGNQILSDQALRAVISLDYPQPLLKIRPEEIARQLEQRAPIISAGAVRQLFPPKISVYVREREPVARSIPAPVQAIGRPESSLGSPYVQPGLLDAQGVWMPVSSFTLLDDNLPLPQLEVYGLRPRDRHHWPQIYRSIRQSPVAIRRLDWQDPNDLVLQTDLGQVRLGPYSDRFPQQITALAQLRRLPEQINPSSIAYIDLRNPEIPSVQFLQASQGDLNSTEDE
ncbi:cell division protein FtsQ [filamentous cyanobacterium CCP5]|nr:cell division protein FtsQ [filamentous cyanobacterium CCP5]